MSPPRPTSGWPWSGRSRGRPLESCAPEASRVARRETRNVAVHRPSPPPSAQSSARCTGRAPLALRRARRTIDAREKESLGPRRGGARVASAQRGFRERVRNDRCYQSRAHVPKRVRQTIERARVVARKEGAQFGGDVHIVGGHASVDLHGSRDVWSCGDGVWPWASVFPGWDQRRRLHKASLFAQTVTSTVAKP